MAKSSWWKRRFADFGVRHGEVEDHAGRATLPFVDPESQQLELVAVDGISPDDLPGTPWPKSPIPELYQIRGLHAVRLIARAYVQHLQE